MSFDDFTTILVQNDTKNVMDGTFGRRRLLKTIMLTGNGKGTAGYNAMDHPWGRNAVSYQKGANRAGLRLCTIDLFEDRTGK